MPTLLYGSETWARTNKEEDGIQTQEIGFLIINIFNIKEKIKEYQIKWKEHVERIDGNMLPARARIYK